MNINLYSILFAVGTAAACYYILFQWQKYGYGTGRYELFVCIEFISIFFGARLVHCLCYEPDYFTHHVTEIFLPITIGASGDWHFTGFQGLASHGGTLGAIAGILLFRLTTRYDIRPILDWTAIATPLLGVFIRMGNFFNQEIIGVPTGKEWGVVFERVDCVPRHPAQLYEAAFFVALFVATAWAYSKRGYMRVRPMFYFGATMTAAATFRFFIEYLKEPQTPAEVGMAMNIGQQLSLPLILAGLSVTAVTTGRRRTCKNKSASNLG
ncbi:MAG: prolipoprotein diacylglyceryl transferase [Candidatus Aphodosoma sp.]